MILINAYACEPHLGSEQGIGWKWVTYISRFYKVHLITADRGRCDLFRSFVDKDPAIANNLTVTFLPWYEPHSNFYKQIVRFYQPLYYVYYRRWLRSSFSLAQSICSSGVIKLVHQNTYMTYREPGDFYKLPVKSMWAPVTGNGGVPFSLLPSLGGQEFLRHGARNIINSWNQNYNKRFLAAITGYTRVVAGCDHTAEFLGRFRNDVEMIPNNLIDSGAPVFSRQISESRAMLQLCFCGLHVSRKGGGYLIKALAKAAKRVPVKLHMLGDGPMSKKWITLAEHLNCKHLITWHGRLPRTNVFKVYSASDVFIFPSLCDVYPTVIAEAMSHGLPVITTNIPGVGDMVDENSGYLLPAETSGGLVDGLAESIVRLATDPVELNRLRTGVRKRAEEFLFEKRMSRLLRIYDELLSTP